MYTMLASRSPETDHIAIITVKEKKLSYHRTVRGGIVAAPFMSRSASTGLEAEATHEIEASSTP
jgi:hypothetical protein